MPVFLGEKNSFDPWVTAKENAARLLHQDPIGVVMTELTSAPIQVATHRMVNVTRKELQQELAIHFPITL